MYRSVPVIDAVEISLFADEARGTRQIRLEARGTRHEARTPNEGLDEEDVVVGLGGATAAGDTHEILDEDPTMPRLLSPVDDKAVAARWRCCGAAVLRCGMPITEQRSSKISHWN